MAPYIYFTYRARHFTDKFEVDLQNMVSYIFTNSLSWRLQGSHFFRLTKFHDISMIFQGFLVNFQVFFSLFLKYDFQVVLNINMQTYWVSFEQKINHFNYTPN